MKADSPVHTRRLARDAAWAFLMRGVGAGSGLVMSFAIARILGATEAGYYLLALAVITFLSSLCRLGMDNTVLRLIAANASNGQWGAVDAVFRQASLYVLLVSGLVGLGLWALSPIVAERIFGKPELSGTLRAIAPGLVGLSLCYVLSFSLQAIHRVAGSVFALSLGTAAGIVVVSPLLASGAEAGRAYSIVSLVTVGVAYLWWRRAHPSGMGSFSQRELWRSAFPLWLVMGMTALQQWGGQFVAGAYVEAADVARLAVAQRISVLISLLLISVNLVVSPRFAALYQQGRIEDLRKTAQVSVRIMLLVAAPLAGLIFVAAEWMMHVFGPAFAEGGMLLRILAAGQFVNAITGSVGSLLMMTGHERDMRNIALIVGPLAIVLALVLTPKFGVTGAAVATAVSIGAQNILAAALVKKRLGFSTMAFWQR